MAIEYVVQGNYGYGWDDLTYETSLADAKTQKRCYDENEPFPHRIVRRTIKSNK
ncbi:MAG: hypothetical protein IKG72_13125 [Bacillus sp. (in: Bacteria)]|nr:hypothetical protein [Parasporobacterium sp.]MBR3381025.1 hypothetical protein [Bacillus sp. (in: firmicutes)]